MTPDVTYLRKLLGDSWVDTEVFGNEPSHWLGLWQKKNPDNVWVRYSEQLAKALLTSNGISFDAETLANKLRSETDCIPTLAEMEWASFLAEKGFAITIEPTAPLRGPDLRADWDGVSFFVEVRTVGFSEDEDRRDAVTKEVFAILNVTPSQYRVMLTVSDEYEPGSDKLKQAIAAVLTSLNVLRDRGERKATLHFAGKNDAVLLFPGTNSSGKYSGILERADFVAQFEQLDKEQSGTPASFFEPLKHPPEPVKDHERLRNILHNKRKQLPSGSRGVIVLDVSELLMLSDFSVERALYGDWLVAFPLVKGPEEPVGETISWRNRRGFLLHTSRVSAVVIQRRSVENEEVKIKRQVYPTNRADSDTIRLNLAELERFGDVEDRKHLSAENAP